MVWFDSTYVRMASVNALIAASTVSKLHNQRGTGMCAKYTLPKDSYKCFFTFGFDCFYSKVEMDSR